MSVANNTMDDRRQAWPRLALLRKSPQKGGMLMNEFHLEHELGGEETQLFPLLFSPNPFYTVQVTD